MRMRPPIRLALLILVLAAAALPVGSALGAKPSYKAFATCANGKPFKAERSCRYDGGSFFRGTFVFKSNTGKHPVKACFRIYGRKPLGGGHACAKLKPLAFKAYPFKITGVRQPFSVKVQWFVNDDGKGFHPVASSFLKVKP